MKSEDWALKAAYRIADEFCDLPQTPSGLIRSVAAGGIKDIINEECPLGVADKKVYVAILQPDGDWNHLADFLGVYTTLEAAKKALDIVGNTRQQCKAIYAVEPDTLVTYSNREQYAVRDPWK